MVHVAVVVVVSGAEVHHYHVHFCFHWCSLRPSQCLSQTQIKTMIFRRKITCHTTFSILSLYSTSLLVWGIQGSLFLPTPCLLPSPRLCYWPLTPWCECKFSNNFRGNLQLKSPLSSKKRKALSPMTGVLGFYMDAVLEARNFWNTFRLFHLGTHLQMSLSSN